jgi:uncharacterized protein YkwD
MKTATLLALLILAVAACKSNDTAVTPTDPTQAGTNNGSNNGAVSGTLKAITNNSLDPNKLVKLVNDIRTVGCKCGDVNMPAVAKIGWNAILEKAAFDHSTDMKAKGYFSHIGKDGRYPWTRAEDAGYKYLLIAENIATGYSTEETVVKSWFESEGHCKNLMKKEYSEMGLGRSGTYWTQMLGQPGK